MDPTLHQLLSLQSPIRAPEHEGKTTEREKKLMMIKKYTHQEAALPLSMSSLWISQLQLLRKVSLVHQFCWKAWVLWWRGKSLWRLLWNIRKMAEIARWKTYLAALLLSTDLVMMVCPFPHDRQNGPFPHEYDVVSGVPPHS